MSNFALCGETGDEPTPTRRKRTPDFTHLLKRDLLSYVKSLGFTDEDAETRASELLEFVKREAEKFT